MKRTSLDAWMQERINKPINRDSIEAAALFRARRVIEYAKERSPWYRSLLGEHPVPDL